MRRMRSLLLSIGLMCAAVIALAACGGTGVTATPSAAAAAPSVALTKPSAAAASTAVSPSVTSSAPASSLTSSFTSATFKVPIGLTLSGGWSLSTDETGTVGLQLGDAAASIMSIDSTTVRGATTTAPWIPWPDDIHAWLAGRPEFKLDATRTAVVGGRPAVIVDADYVRERITDQGDWIKYGTDPTDGLNMKGSWPGSVHIVVVKTGPKSGIVMMMDGPTDAFGGASTSLDRVLGTLTFR